MNQSCAITLLLLRLAVWKLKPAVQVAFEAWSDKVVLERMINAAKSIHFWGQLEKDFADKKPMTIKWKKYEALQC